MNVVCFSSFTFSYLNRARVLFQSLRQHMPHWRLVALITDVPPATGSFDPRNEPFDEVVYSADLGIDNFHSWLFKHDVIEACTAVKGPFSYRAALADDIDAIVYLDPDTCVFGSLQPLEILLQCSDIILTPHSLEPDTARQAIIDNEICSLKTGIYNLGFCAFSTRGEGARFAKWWNDRLLSFCYDDIPNGLFVDQRWCDHVPSFFENVKILRDPGYNVASWNLSNRNVSISRTGEVFVNEMPLRFWHFTKLGPIGDVMTKRYAGNNFPVYELWNWYRHRVRKATDSATPAGYWFYDSFDNGAKVSKSHRLLYRSRLDLQAHFPEPFVTGRGSFYEWLRAEKLADDLVAR